MKIVRLDLKNFGCYSKLGLELPEKVSIFWGASGAGKSTLLHAIEACLLGTARGIPSGEAAKLGADWGAKRWKVEATIQRGDKVLGLSRTASTRSVLTPDGERVKVRQDQIHKALHASSSLLKALLSLGAVDLSPDELKKIVTPLAGIEVTEATLWEKGILDSEIAKLASGGEWAKAERTAAEKKRSAARAMKLLRAEKPEDKEVPAKGGTVFLSEITDEHVQKVKDWLAQVPTAESALMARLADAKAWEKMGPEVLKKRIAETQTRLAEIAGAAARLKEATAELKEKESLERDVIRGLDELRHQAQAEPTAQKKALQAIGDMVARAEGGKCPTCGQDMPAVPIDEEAMAKLQAEADAHGRAAKEKHLALDSGKKLLEETRGETRALQGEILELKAKVREECSLQGQIETAMRRLAEPPKQSGDTVESLNAALNSVRETVGKYRALLREAEDYRARLLAYERTVEEIERLEKKAALYEEIEHLCRPGGLRKKLLAPVLGPIRERLAKWEGLLPWTLVLNDDFGLELGIGTSRVPLSLLSTGERWRAAIMLTDALAQLAGLRWMAIDNTERVEHGKRKALIGMLAKIRENYDQILLFGITPEKVTAAPAGSGFAVYVVGEGQAMEVKA